MNLNQCMLVIVLQLFHSGLCAETNSEIPGAPQGLQSANEQLAIQEQQSKKQPPPDYVDYDQPPQVLKQVQPEYPNEALKDKLEGLVWVDIWLDETGKVVDAKIGKSSAAVFEKPAIEAAKQWQFKPAIAKEKPIAVWVRVPFKFKFGDGKSVSPSMGKPVNAPDKGAQIGKTQEQPPPADYTPYEKAPEVIKQVQPKYPEEAKKAKVEGTVWVKVWIGESGKPLKAGISRSEAIDLNQPALDAAMKWVFKPAIANGKPTAVWVDIPFRFKLADENKEK